MRITYFCYHCYIVINHFYITTLINASSCKNTYTLTMPKDIKRVRFANMENTPSCSKKPECEDCKSFHKKLTTLQESVESLKHELKSCMTSQNVAVMSALAEQKVITQKLVRQDSLVVSMKSFFPLNSTEDLTNINHKVIPETRSIMISTIRSMLQYSISKNLKNVFTNDIIMNYNVDGTHGKKSLKEFKNLYQVLIESITSLSSPDDPETQLRKALQLNKKRFFQKRPLSRNLLRNRPNRGGQTIHSYSFG
ncbi:PREDICTED: uncharacterized protein LOC108369083 isoform X1 [Rhagoletis zephyria]|uniref:uncharacterized protein LOC108369083 isoform X1 n=1 Tax=Rhagoletis zephyria TaxID=28612 RepID=UPI00081168B0|nr:PREDICTED: uncharacterized protein LOC108369083 isoform X1 [Rhagoletis zephyria]